MTGLKPHILAAKQQLAEGRAKLRARHERGSPGIQVCRALTELFDGVLITLFETAVADLGDENLKHEIALVPHGGYGRADVAPYSDVDLMILHEASADARAARLAERLVRDVYDVGLQLGQSIRTAKQACDLAVGDATICTSLIEARLLVGSAELYERFSTSFLRAVQRRSQSLMAAVDEARAEERRQYGETVYLLEPNLKRSPGGLRDIQLLRWIGFICYGASDPDSLRLRGVLAHADHDALLRAHEFLLRVRNEMHFHADKSYDVLDRAEQLRLAEVFDHKGTEGMLPVEQFMREYFRHTTRISAVSNRFVTTARRPWWTEWIAPLVSHRFESDFRVEPKQISANRRWLARMPGSLLEVLRLADVANLYDKPIAHRTCEAIRAAVPQLPDTVSPEVAARFRSLLNQPARLGPLLHDLHEMGVLERIIPAFTHARSLLQFNAYHKYTVDEHCLRAVGVATGFARDTGPLGAVYKHLKRKWLLHLALLIHDLGKGFAEDHSEVGLRIASELVGRLYINRDDGETLKFLVHKHLMMGHLAFRRDTSDNDLIVRFAVEVGSPEVLEMLFLLTAADMAAVGPGVLNAWKIEVLADLFHRTLAHLGGDDPTAVVEARHQQRRQEVLRLLATLDHRRWYEQQVAALPNAYLLVTPPAVIVADLQSLRELADGDALARGRYQPETATVEYTVGTYDNITPGVFHKLTGALTSQGLQILSAEINTLAEGLVLDRFHVQDPDFAGEPPASRLADVERALVMALRDQESKPPIFRRIWRPPEQRRQESLSPLPTQVRADNNMSDRYTILDIFAADRMGLLYTITRTLFELNLNVAVAKIGTYLDQVVDVFYVTGGQGRKIDDQAQLDEIRQRLLSAISTFEQQEAAQARSSW